MKNYEKRFYVAKSFIYGITVYDRITQTPAFYYGADCNMANLSATMLSAKLNGHERNGNLDLYNEERIKNQ